MTHKPADGKKSTTAGWDLQSDHVRIDIQSGAFDVKTQDDQSKVPPGHTLCSLISPVACTLEA
jgi:hypothetical protein